MLKTPLISDVTVAKPLPLAIRLPAIIGHTRPVSVAPVLVLIKGGRQQ